MPVSRTSRRHHGIFSRLRWRSWLIHMNARKSSDYILWFFCFVSYEWHTKDVTYRKPFLPRNLISVSSCSHFPFKSSRTLIQNAVFMAINSSVSNLQSPIHSLVFKRSCSIYNLTLLRSIERTSYLGFKHIRMLHASNIYSIRSNIISIFAMPNPKRWSHINLEY